MAIFLLSVLSEWVCFHTADHGATHTGGFNTGGRAMTGEQYATQGANGSSYAFVAESDTDNGLNCNASFKRTGDNMNHFL